MATKIKLPFLGLLASATVLLASCGGSGAGLIPTANAGPLQSDFERVAQLAQEGEGNCGPTRRALEKTESDLEALPKSVDAGLRSKLAEGINNLRRRALEACEQPGTSTASTTITSTTISPSSSTTTSSSTTSSSTSSSETTSESSTSEPPTTSTTPTEPSQGGGTQAPSGNEAAGEAAGGAPGGGVVP